VADSSIVKNQRQVRPLRVALLLLVSGAVSILVPLSSYGWLFLVALTMGLLVIIPAGMSWNRGKFDAFEAIHILGFRYFLFFGVGALWLMMDPYEIAYDRYLVAFVPRAAFYCMLGYICMVIGYYGPWFPKRAPREFEDVPIGPVVLLLPGLLGFVGNIAEALLGRSFWLGTAISGVVSSTAQLAPLYYFSWSLAWLLVFSGRASRSQRWSLYLVFIPMTLIILSNNLTDKSLALTLFGVPLMALWYAKRVLPWRALTVLVLVLIFVIFPFFNTFRIIDPRIQSLDRVSMTLKALTEMNGDEFMDVSVGTFKKRLSLISSVAVVVRDVPRWEPYANGSTIFIPALSLFVPRILWPDKPMFTMGRDFGEKFRIVNILDDKTRISATVPGELYWNFSLPGILIGMAIWGALMRWIYRHYAGSVSLDPVRKAVYVVLLIQFVHFGGGLAGNGVNVIRTLMVIEIFLLVCRRLDLLQSARVSEIFEDSAPI
jgi:hypothetical protein